MKQGRYHEAIAVIQAAIEVEKEAGFAVPEKWATDLASAYKYTGNWTAAHEQFEFALRLGEATGDPDKTINPLYRLGQMQKQKGLFQQARVTFTRMLKATDAIAGPDGPDALFSNGDLAKLHSSWGKPHTALSYYKRSLQIHHKLYGQEHLDVAATHGAMATMHQRLGHYVRSLEEQRLSYEGYCKVYGSSDSELENPTMSLGRAHHRIGRFREAARYHGDAAKIAARVYGAQHTNALESYEAEADSYRGFGDRVEAFRLLEKALEGRVLLYEGDAHPEVARLTRKLVVMLVESGRQTEAIAMQERHVVAASLILGQRHPKLLNGLLELAELHVSSEDPKSCQAAARMAVDLIPKLRDAYGSDHHRVIRALVLQGKAYHRLGLLKAAAESLDDAISLETGEPPVRHPVLREAERILETVQKLSEHDADPAPAFMDNPQHPPIFAD